MTDRVTVHTVVAEVAARRFVKPGTILAGNLLRPVVLARHEAMFEARCQRKPDGRHRWSLPLIGQRMGGLDHTTVLNGVRRHIERTGLSPDEAARALAPIWLPAGLDDGDEDTRL